MGAGMRALDSGAGWGAERYGAVRWCTCAVRGCGAGRGAGQWRGTMQGGAVCTCGVRAGAVVRGAEGRWCGAVRCGGARARCGVAQVVRERSRIPAGEPGTGQGR
ncbi:hypothetical protein GCM10010327_26370 [Streptomyces nitrosporeus]|nr:hypothetical protein GCM10010327_26370 [Streptomyces nitrosporeus]